MKYGYVRATTEEFKKTQIDFLQNKTDQIIIENNDKELDGLLEILQTGDTLYIYDFDRLTRHLDKARKIVEVLLNKNVDLYTVKGNINIKNLAYGMGIISQIEQTDDIYEAKAFRICFDRIIINKEELKNILKNRENKMKEKKESGN